MKKYYFHLIFQKKSIRKIILKLEAGIRLYIEY